jgi:dTMP kinase
MKHVPARSKTRHRATRGFFVTLEGVEGCGKSTQSRLLASRLCREGFRVVLTAEPGGTPAGRAIRKRLLAPGGRVGPDVELLLFEADRALHVRQLIFPALARGAVVVCDRFSDSTRAYQGGARELDARLVETLDHAATGGLQPDLTLLLDVPVKEGLRRARARGGLTRLDRERALFHGRVRRAYLGLAARNRERIRVVDATRPPRETAAAVWREVERALLRRRRK